MRECAVHGEKFGGRGHGLKFNGYGALIEDNVFENIDGLVRGNAFESVTGHFAPTDTYHSLRTEACTDVGVSNEVQNDARLKN